MNLAGFAAAVRGVAARCEADLARECAQVAAREYHAALEITTPVLTGALRESMHVISVTGGGAVAVAEVGSDLIYARFRNDGGTIRVKHARVLTDGTRFFGKEVHQAGARYIEKAEAWAEGPIRAACQVKLDEMITLP